MSTMLAGETQTAVKVFSHMFSEAGEETFIDNAVGKVGKTVFTAAGLDSAEWQIFASCLFESGRETTGSLVKHSISSAKNSLSLLAYGSEDRQTAREIKDTINKENPGTHINTIIVLKMLASTPNRFVLNLFKLFRWNRMKSTFHASDTVMKGKQELRELKAKRFVGGLGAVLGDQALRQRTEGNTPTTYDSIASVYSQWFAEQNIDGMGNVKYKGSWVNNEKVFIEELHFAQQHKYLFQRTANILYTTNVDPALLALWDQDSRTDLNKLTSENLDKERILGKSPLAPIYKKYPGFHSLSHDEQLDIIREFRSRGFYLESGVGRSSVDFVKLALRAFKNRPGAIARGVVECLNEYIKDSESYDGAYFRRSFLLKSEADIVYELKSILGSNLGIQIYSIISNGDIALSPSSEASRNLLSNINDNSINYDLIRDSDKRRIGKQFAEWEREYGLRAGGKRVDNLIGGLESYKGDRVNIVRENYLYSSWIDVIEDRSIIKESIKKDHNDIKVVREYLKKLELRVAILKNRETYYESSGKTYVSNRDIGRFELNKPNLDKIIELFPRFGRFLEERILKGDYRGIPEEDKVSVSTEMKRAFKGISKDKLIEFFNKLVNKKILMTTYNRDHAKMLPNWLFDLIETCQDVHHSEFRKHTDSATHDSVLTDSLTSVSGEALKELPVARQREGKFLVGHIDGVALRGSKIYIEDYKPLIWNKYADDSDYEKTFIREFLDSCIQICVYGLLLNSNGVKMSEMEGVFYNKQGGILFDIGALMTQVKIFLKENGKTIPWSSWF